MDPFFLHNDGTTVIKGVPPLHSHGLSLEASAHNHGHAKRVGLELDGRPLEHPQAAHHHTVHSHDMGRRHEQTCATQAMAQTFCSARDMDVTEKLVGMMREGSLKPNLVTFNSVVNEMCKVVRMKDTCKVFDEMLNGVCRQQEAGTCRAHLLSCAKLVHIASASDMWTIATWPEEERKDLMLGLF